MISAKEYYAYQVVKTSVLREGVLFVETNPRRIIVGSRKPTEYEAIVMEGFAKSHPWFRDPLLVGAEAWRIIEQTAKDQGYEMRVSTRGPQP